MLDREVPEGEYLAAQAGDSPFLPGEVLYPGTRLHKPVPAWRWTAPAEEKPIPFDYRVLARTPQLLVVDKPHFLPVSSNGRLVTETVQTRARVRENNPFITPLHRLDRLTAGVVLLSTNPATRAAYHGLFSGHAIRKTYQAEVIGTPAWAGPIGGQWRELSLFMLKRSRTVAVVKQQTPGAKKTVTRVRRVGDSGVELQPMTGHTHQLRVLCAHFGTPIQGDDLYPHARPLDLYDFSTPLRLYANHLEFEDPVTKMPVVYQREEIGA